MVMDVPKIWHNTKVYYRSKFRVTACFLYPDHIDGKRVRYTVASSFQARITSYNSIIMKLNRMEFNGILAALILVVLAGVFFLTQRVAYADTDPCSLPGMSVFDCDENKDNVTDPCDLPGMDANPDCNGGIVEDGEGDSLAEEINCEIYAQLMAQGSPIPQGFDASGCDDDDDDNGDGGGDTPACADGEDNDGDSLVDSADPGCADSNDDDESNGDGGSTAPACSDGSDNDGDGKIDMDDPGCSEVNDTDETDPSSGGGGSGSGSGGGEGGGGGGSTLGAATSTQCVPYLTGFIKQGASNDKQQVLKLQAFLKVFEGARVELNGIYDSATISAVHSFQTKHQAEVLAPWSISQSTGFVYLTTRKKINEVYCNHDIKFLLTPDENQVIETSKVAPAKAKPQTAVPAKPVEPAAAKAPTKAAVPSTASEEGATRGGWGAVGDFFRRLFNRGR